MINIVLVHPKIPSNTGNIGRLALGLDATLHLIKPLGFSLDEKSVKRAGLDYWDNVKLKTWENIDTFWHSNPLNDRHFFATTKTTQNYFEKKFKKDDYIYFGAETTGLSEEILKLNPQNNITIPMTKNIRSINLSNSVAIIAYEVVRQYRDR